VETRNRATSSEEARKEVLERVEKEKAEFVLLWFTDLEGHLKSFAITPEELEGALDDGMGFDGSSITGFNAIEESDMVAIPDPGTFQVMPWKEGETRVARMICDVVTPDGQPYEGDPRYVLRRALERMEAMGFDTFNIGPELEYFLFKDDAGTETLDEGGYFAMTTMDAAGELRNETIRALTSVGIPVEYHHHEVGPSQHEIDMRFSPALEMADHTITYRLIVKEVAKKAGFHASFMPKPIFGENGSGMHTHQSLFTGGRNRFFDADDEWHLSDVGKAFIAGQLRHARELSAVFAQWVNSYKRLVPGFEAPVYVAWSRRNRSALIRIPLYKPGAEQATRAELRCPDPACNPYLTFAALLHAGLEGIEQGYELPPPMETNLYHLTAEQRRERGIVSLPETLGEAIDELAQSDLMRRALGPHIFDRYVELKRKEWDEYRVQLSEWEMKKYLAVL
jgi:glutamine synthetase